MLFLSINKQISLTQAAVQAARWPASYRPLAQTGPQNTKC